MSARSDYILEVLEKLRAMRDIEDPGSEIRHVFNTACDRLDVLHSRVKEWDDIPGQIQSEMLADERRARALRREFRIRDESETRALDTFNEKWFR